MRSAPALFVELCRQAGVKTQYFTNRSDLKGGGTLGSISTSQVSIASVDIGLPQLAMHSCNETAGIEDSAAMIPGDQAVLQHAPLHAGGRRADSAGGLKRGCPVHSKNSGNRGKERGR